MPEEAILESPAQETAVPQGIEGAMKAFEEVVSPKPKETVKEAPVKDEPVKEGIKEPVAADPKAEVKTDPNVKVEDIWSKAPGKLKGEHFKTVRVLEDKISNFEKKIKEIESKRVEAPTDTKVIEQYTKQIRDLEQKIAATDYRQSPEFQKNFVTKWHNEYKATVNDVKQLFITTKDGEGNESQRAATESDFQRIMRFPAAEQDRMIHEMFGHYAPRVIARIMRLQEIERSSEDALTEHAANAEKLSKEAQAARDRSENEYKTHYDSSVAQLEKGWPQYFAADEKDNEATTALQQGYKFVDDTLANAANMTADERAAANAVIRGRAAGFARVVLDNNRLKAELESVKTELGKYRKSDPGADAGAGQVSAVSEDEVPKGIDEAIKAFAGLK